MLVNQNYVLPLSKISKIGQELYSHQLEIANWSNEPECFITPSWKGLPGTSAQAYGALIKVMNKMKFCEYDSRSHCDTPV